MRWLLLRPIPHFSLSITTLLFVPDLIGLALLFILLGYVAHSKDMVGEMDGYYSKAKSRSHAYFAAGSEFSSLLTKQRKQHLLLHSTNQGHLVVVISRNSHPKH